MEIHRGYAFPLKPTPDQADRLGRWIGTCRLLWNLALEQRATWGRSHKLKRFTQVPELKHLRAEFDFMEDVPSNAQQWVLIELNKAYTAFFEGRAGHPRFHAKSLADGIKFCRAPKDLRMLNAKWAEIRIPKLGWVKVRLARPIEGEIRNIVVSQSSLGWQVVITVRHTVPDSVPATGEMVGIDLGVTVPVMLSTGEEHHLPARLARLERQHRRAQRIAARRKRGSNRHARARRRAAQIKAQAARIRQAWQDELTTDISRRFAAVKLEDLRTRNMTRSAKGTLEAPGRNVRQKAGLNRSILNVGWGGLRFRLDYKLAQRGGRLFLVDPAYTSLTCSKCGQMDRSARKSQALFICGICKTPMNADLNAALNILKSPVKPGRRGAPPLLRVEACDRATFEARTCAEEPRNEKPLAGGEASLNSGRREET